MNKLQDEVQYLLQTKRSGQTLDDLFNAERTDKGSLTHNYSPHYERFLKPLRNQPISLLEIGINDPRFPGASLRVWEKYLKQARITGLDIVPSHEFDTERVTTHVGDQGNVWHLSRMANQHGPFDIIIDDGSHSSQHIITSFFALFPMHMNPGGMYFIEDLKAATWAQEFFTRFPTNLHVGTERVEWLVPDQLVVIHAVR